MSGKRRMDEGIIKQLTKKQPLQRKELKKKLVEDENIGSDRTLSNALERMRGKTIRRIEEGVDKGKYALINYLSFGEVADRIRNAIEKLTQDFDMVTLDDISTESMVPKEWCFKEGDSSIGFEDVSFGIARQKELKIGDESKKKDEVLIK